MLVAAPQRFISAATLVEAGIVAERQNPRSGAKDLDLLLERLEIDVIPLTREHAELAAYRQFGKGLHPAGLNHGDCFSYALSRALGEPLLFIGNDFARTDVEAAVY